MSAIASLLAECRTTLDDDGPRRVWADAIGGERGELVVLQCELAQRGLSSTQSGLLRARARELLDSHGRAWSELDTIARRCLFRRGFVEAIELDGFRDGMLGELLARAPMSTAVTVRGATPADIDRVLAAPELGELRGLSIELHHHFPASALIERLLASDRLGNLRALGLDLRLHAGEGERLAALPVLAHLERLALSSYNDELTRDFLAAVLARTPLLRALALGLHEAVEDLIPASVVELDISTLSTQFEALAASPLAASLERLRLPYSVGDAVDLLGDFTCLRALDLAQVDLGLSRDPSLHLSANVALARVSMPALCELSVPITAWGEDVRAVADAFGPQLALFRCQHIDRATTDHVRARIGGQALIETALPEAPMFQAAVAPAEPWIRPGIVDLGPRP